MAEVVLRDGAAFARVETTQVCPRSTPPFRLPRDLRAVEAPAPTLNLRRHELEPRSGGQVERTRLD